jgi:ABC-2 type transport system permease protein
MFTSNALYPISQMPWWVRSIAVANPVTHASTLTRFFLIGKGDPASTLASFLALAVFSVSSMLLGYLAFKRSLRR